jgi:hypothetical protein
LPNNINSPAKVLAPHKVTYLVNKVGNSSGNKINKVGKMDNNLVNERNKVGNNLVKLINKMDNNLVNERNKVGNKVGNNLVNAVKISLRAVAPTAWRARQTNSGCTLTTPPPKQTTSAPKPANNGATQLSVPSSNHTQVTSHE